MDWSGGSFVASLAVLLAFACASPGVEDTSEADLQEITRVI